eukprot:15397172-Alexandrium_andersonii.AAC.1
MEWKTTFEQGALSLLPAPLSLVGRPLWRSACGEASAIDEGPVLVAPYSIGCPLGCGAQITLPSKPSKDGSSWPKVRCAICGKTGRI